MNLSHSKFKKQANFLTEPILLLTFLILCLLFIEKYEISNGFTILASDRYDGIINTSILEHWFNFFKGSARWSDASYFYPYKRTIAQTDAFFLVGLAYTPFRLLGFDPFISSELAGLTIKSVGFISMYLFSRKVISLSFYWAVLAAILFTLSNNMTIHSMRLQFATVAFSPLLSLLLFRSINEFNDGNVNRFRKYGLCAGILLGAWCLTCFYMAWFYCFFVTFLFFWLILLNGSSHNHSLWTKVSSNLGSIFFVISMATVSLIPFIWSFFPKSQEVGTRSYDSVFLNTIPLEGILRTGRDNLLFGRFYEEMLSYISPNYAPVGDIEYYNTGFSIPLFVLFVYGCFDIFKAWRQRKSDFLLFSIVLAAASTWLFAIKIFGVSAWFFVYHVFPGAKALNVVSAYQIFLAFPVVLIAVLYFSKHRPTFGITFLLVFLLIAAEANRPYLNLDRNLELNRIAIDHSPPQHCQVFYVSGWNDLSASSDLIINYYAHNVTAMMIAQIVHIPTINGFASFNIPDWNFGYPNNPDYDSRVLDYARKHKISGLCKYDLNNKVWSPASIDFREERWPGTLTGIRGVSIAEGFGRWSNADEVVMDFVSPLAKKFKLVLNAGAFGPNVDQPFKIKIGQLEQEFRVGLSPQEVSLIFDCNNIEKTIRIVIPKPVSPKELGMSLDDRRLGIALGQLRIESLEDW